MSSVSTADGMVPGSNTTADSGRAAVGFSARRFVAALATVVGAGVLLIAGANYFLDPLHFSASGQRQVAAGLAFGEKYPAVRADNGFCRLPRGGDRQNN